MVPVIWRYFFAISGDNSDMSGSKCRENLIKLTCFFSDKQDTQTGRKIFTMLLSLVELQKLAYSLEEFRTEKSILRAHCQAYKFGSVYSEIFSHPAVKKPRTMFGMSFHSLTCHLAETLRIISCRSIVAEQAERHFNKLRYADHTPVIRLTLVKPKMTKFSIITFS